jgi:hypothetical protein
MASTWLHFHLGPLHTSVRLSPRPKSTPAQKAAAWNRAERMRVSLLTPAERAAESAEQAARAARRRQIQAETDKRRADRKRRRANRKDVTL